MMFLAILLTANVMFGQSLQKISPRLQSLMTKDAADLEVIVMLKEQVDVYSLYHSFNDRALNQLERINELIPALQSMAASTQGTVVDWMIEKRNIPREDIRAFWLVNAFSFVGSSEDILALAARDDISELTWDAPNFVEEYSCEAPAEEAVVFPGISEVGLRLINASPLWEMGYTGYGTIALSADQGIDAMHPAYSNRWMGSYSSPSDSWFPGTGNNTFPFNCGDHGSHTLGTIVGLDHRTNDTIGVAPQANWIGAPNLCGGAASSNLGSFEWALNPDNDLQTTADMPTVINNSWRDGSLPTGGLECNSAYVGSLTALEAAGIAVIFSAGNSGADGVSSITPPKNINLSLVNAFCVGNINGGSTTLPINPSSSRGPSVCGGTGSLLIKPEVSAPGTSVRSCSLNRTYDYKSGTSMAAPHVAGAILLLKEAFPALLSEDLKLALYNTAVDLGDPGEDNDYGMGIIDVTAAFDYLVGLGNVPTQPNTDLDLIGADADAQTNYCDGALEMTFYLTNGGDMDITSFDYTIDVATNFGAVVFSTNGNWSGNMAQSEIVAVDEVIDGLNAGEYFVNFVASNPNDSDDPRPLNNAVAKLISVNSNPAISYKINNEDAGTFCNGSRVLLTGDLDVDADIRLRWYSDFLAEDLIGAGNEWLSPVITEPTEVFVKAEIDVSAGADAPTDGDFTNNNQLRVSFLSDLRLRSMDIVSEAAASVIVQLINADDEIVKVKSFNLPSAGVHTVFPEFDVDAGQYKIGLLGGTKLLEKTTGLQFPYVGGSELIVLGSTNGNSSYAYFYNIVVSRDYDCEPRRINLVPTEGIAVDMEIELDVDTIEVNTNVNVALDNSSLESAEWLFGDGNNASGLTATHQYTEAGIYLISVVATDADGCNNARQKIIVVLDLTSINETLANSKVKLYPNPTDGQLTIEMTDFHHKGDIQFYDLGGRLVRSVAGPTHSNATFTVDLSDLPAGMYWLKMSSSELGDFARKVIVQ